MTHPPLARTQYRCRVCGATSYRRLIGPDAQGRWTVCAGYRCTGCSLSFSDPQDWHTQTTPPQVNAPASA